MIDINREGVRAWPRCPTKASGPCSHDAVTGHTLLRKSFWSTAVSAESNQQAVPSHLPFVISSDGTVETGATAAVAGQAASTVCRVASFAPCNTRDFKSLRTLKSRRALVDGTRAIRAGIRVVRSEGASHGHETEDEGGLSHGGKVAD